MNTDFTYRDKIRVGIPGSETVLGESYTQAFGDHPWFELVMPSDSDMFVDCQLICSALEAGQSSEELLASQGHPVITCRHEGLQKNVPLIMPEVDISCLRLINAQSWGKKGAIIALPSNEAAIAALIVKAIASKLNIDKIHLKCPLNRNEEDGFKLKSELNSLLGDRISAIQENLTIEELEFQSSNLVIVNLEFSISNKLIESEVAQFIEEYRGIPQELNLPKAMEAPIAFHENLIEVQDLSVSDHLINISVISQDPIALKTYMALMTAEILVKYGYVFW